MPQMSRKITSKARGCDAIGQFFATKSHLKAYFCRAILNNFLGKLFPPPPQWGNMKFNLKPSTFCATQAELKITFSIFISHFWFVFFLAAVVCQMIKAIFRRCYFLSLLELSLRHFEIDWRCGCLLLLMYTV